MKKASVIPDLLTRVLMLETVDDRLRAALLSLREELVSAAVARSPDPDAQTLYRDIKKGRDIITRLERLEKAALKDAESFEKRWRGTPRASPAPFRQRRRGESSPPGTFPAVREKMPLIYRIRAIKALYARGYADPRRSLKSLLRADPNLSTTSLSERLRELAGDCF